MRILHAIYERHAKIPNLHGIELSRDVFIEFLAIAVKFKATEWSLLASGFMQHTMSFRMTHPLHTLGTPNEKIVLVVTF